MHLSFCLALLHLVLAQLETFSSASKVAESVTIRIIHVTDVYTLENFASLETLISEKKRENGIQKTISLLSGDFLMPYLLSTIDGGKGMMNMINAVPIDYLTWGNHENDLPHHQLMEREREYNGVWINTNMQSHESFHNSTSQVDFDIIKAQNGDHFRQIAMLGILTNAVSLLPPGSFNGAVIADPWETMRQYDDLLKDTVDLVLPICHLYEAQDERTASEFDFPLILGGHDHHPVNRIVNGTRILKPGSDASYAQVIDIMWSHPDSMRPTITSELVSVNDYTKNVVLHHMAEEAYRVLDPLRQTQIGLISDDFRPLFSKSARSNRVSMATYLGTIIRDALKVDAFIAKGGNFRGSRHYEDDQQFTLDLLQTEIGNVGIYITKLPGFILQVGLRETWTQPGSGWFQHDAGVVVDDEGLVVSVNGEPLNLERVYVIATMADWFRSRDGPSIGRYYDDNPEQKSTQKIDRAYPIILKYLAEQAWHTIFTILDADTSGSIDEEEFSRVDADDDGRLNQHDAFHALQNIVGFQVCPGQHMFVDYLLQSAGGINSTLGDALLDLNDVYGDWQSESSCKSRAGIDGCDFLVEAP